METILYYLVIATLVSLFWMLVAGRPAGSEALWHAALHLLGIVAVTSLLFFLWQRRPALTVGMAVAYVLATILLWYILGDWNNRGHAFLTAFGAAQLAFLGRVAWAIFTSGLALPVFLISLALFAAEFVVILLTLYFTFEVLDVMCRLRWRRLAEPHTGANDYWPKVSIHVPAHAEPPEMVMETLNALRNLDYPSYEVIMVDDNTDDDELWRPLIEYCHRHGIKVFHLQNYPGFKSGALNFALTQTAPDVEIIAVVDSDYLVQPNFLRETVPYFRDPRVAFVQTPQAFGNDDANRFARYSALAQRFFFEISMRSRNERNAIIFCGTMGLIRKRALQRIGGWDEWCITEDAEASLRLLQKGYRSLYIHRAYGHGLLPTTFADTKKQRFRWAFGGMQILRRYWQQLLPLPVGHRPTLSVRQRLSYLMGLLGWLNDLLFLFFTFLLLLTSAALVGGWQLPVRQLAEWILLVPLLSITTGVLRVAWALRATTDCTWQESFGAFSNMLALSLTVARACASALRDPSGSFLRTPKFAVRSSLARAFSAARQESIVGTILLATALLLLSEHANRAGLLLAALLVWHGLVYLSALRAALVETVPAGVPRHEAPVERTPELSAGQG